MATYKLPEQYLLDETVNVPNNELPALVYRNVLPEPPTSESAQQICKGNGWEKRGEWGEIKTPHFHPNTHECYAIFRGLSRLVLGRAREDSDKNGVEVDVHAGDVIVVPAGVSHRSLYSSDGYKYIGVYPESAPKWRNNFCKGEEALELVKQEIAAVALPESDPVYGSDGPLISLWKAAKS